MPQEPAWNSAFARDLNASIMTATACRKFLRTDRGFMGLAPRLAEVGDEVWILPGCDVPMLLRKFEDYHILVGECFVYGMMEGEQTKSLLACNEFEKYHFTLIGLKSRFSSRSDKTSGFAAFSSVHQCLL
jgi:hypothetical protein